MPVMKLIGAMRIERDKVLSFKADALSKMFRAVLHITHLDYTKIRIRLDAYLKSLGLTATDSSVMAWLQENPGDYIGIFVFAQKPNNYSFLLCAGSEAELRQRGEHQG